MASTGNMLNRRAFLALTGVGAFSLALPGGSAWAEEGDESTLVARVAADDSAFEELYPGAVNELGEGTYIPGDCLGEDGVAEESMALAASSGGVAVTELKGATRYETAALEALKAYSSSKYVLIASGTSFADSIAAAGLAGALACPILLSERDSLHSATASAMSQLGVSNAIILGGEAVIGSGAYNAIKAKVSNVSRLAGTTRYGTQMQIWSYGVSNNLWQGDTVYIATGESFADALSASPLCFAGKSPVFFVDGSKALPSDQLNAIKSATQFKKFIVLGGEACISAATYSKLSSIASSRGGSVTRLAGETRYETSAEVGKYAVQNLGFTWDGVAFTSGQLPFDALAGAPMQGRYKHPLLLADSASTVSSRAAKGSVTSALTFLGGYSAVSIAARVSVCAELGCSLYSNVGVTSYGISISAMAALEEKQNKGYGNNSAATFYDKLDPGKFSYNTAEFLQFAVLNGGYSGVSAAALNNYVAGNCSWSEKSYGRTSVLRSHGDAFVTAARNTGLNEVYLVAHSCLETAWGCSELACGWTADKDYTVTFNGKTYTAKKGTTYYNLYGIGAYDNSPLSGGRAMAVKEGWTSVDKAVLGAAKWIKSNYHERSNARQNTLYLMRYDLPDAVKSSPSVWHQYCTSIDWVLSIAKLMCNCYSSAGIGIADIPVKFDVPSYSGA